MTRKEFIQKMETLIDEWNQHYTNEQEKNLDDWPEEMGEPDWFEQFLMYWENH